MPISFACECGKQMQAKDEFAGRRMKCPNCQKILTIPATAPATAAAAPPLARRAVPSSATVPTTQPVRFSCSCGKQLQASLSNAGRKMRCSGCGEIVTIPAEDEAESYVAAESAEPEEAVQASGPARACNVWADPSLDQHLTPWRDERTELLGGDNADRPPPSRGWLAALLVILLLVGAGTAGWYYWPDITNQVERKAAEEGRAAKDIPAFDH